MNATITSDMIPATCADALALWDAGQPVVTVSMGGLGFGYEAAIQTLAFEFIRKWDGKLTVPAKDDHAYDQWQKDREAECNQVCSSIDKEWGFSGAQYGAAKSLAGRVCINGYREALSHPSIKDRLIMFTKTTPAEAIARMGEGADE